MAAYLVGKRGRLRDVVTVGATVTITHTAGVLVLGLLIALGAQFATVVVEQDLAIISGGTVALVGAGLLVSALRRRRGRAGRRSVEHLHHLETDTLAASTLVRQACFAGHALACTARSRDWCTTARRRTRTHDHPHHDHPHPHDHPHDDHGHDHPHPHQEPALHAHGWGKPHSHGPGQGALARSGDRSGRRSAAAA